MRGYASGLCFVSRHAVAGGPRGMRPGSKAGGQPGMRTNRECGGVLACGLRPPHGNGSGWHPRRGAPAAAAARTETSVGRGSGSMPRGGPAAVQRGDGAAAVAALGGGASCVGRWREHRGEEEAGEREG